MKYKRLIKGVPKTPFKLGGGRHLTMKKKKLNSCKMIVIYQKVTGKVINLQARTSMRLAA